MLSAFLSLATCVSPSWYKLPWPAWFRRSVAFVAFLSRKLEGPLPGNSSSACTLNGALEQRGAEGLGLLSALDLYARKVFTCFLRSFWVYSL